MSMKAMDSIVKMAARNFYLAIRRCRLVTRIIFGVNFLPLQKSDYYFDVTTIVIVEKLLKTLNLKARVLDMGTGTSAVIGLSLWKKLKCFVVSSDIDPEIIFLARQNIEYNKAPITVIKSQFFDNIPEAVDTVVFNPPYVPAETGLRRNLLNQRRCQWDGGENGTAIIEKFLVDFEKVDYSLTAYIGINRKHVPQESMLDLIKKRKQIFLEEIYKHSMFPVDIYIIHNK